MFVQLNSIYSLVYLGHYYEHYSNVKKAILKTKYDNNIFMNRKELLSKYKKKQKHKSKSKTNVTFSNYESMTINQDKFTKYSSDIESIASTTSEDSCYIIDAICERKVSDVIFVSKISDDDDISIKSASNSEDDYCLM